jgi:integral membrane protein (TIGR00529 family)
VQAVHERIAFGVLQMPAIAKILIVFASMLALTRARLQLGLAVVLGGLALNLWTGLSVAETSDNLLNAFLAPKTWLILGITWLIIEVGRFVTEEKNADEIVAATRRWGGKHGKTYTLTALPAAIGLIPMPGGALLSAPFVEQAGQSVEGEPEWKSAVNYWFRHIWEYWWPLYPGVVLGMAIFNIELWKFAVTQVFFTPVAAIAGYLFLVRPRLDDLSSDTVPLEGSNRRALFLLLPLITAVVSLFFLSFVLAKIYPGMNKDIRNMVAMLLGLMVALPIIFIDRLSGRSSGGRMFSTLFTTKSLNVQLSLAGVLVFNELLADSGLLPMAAGELKASGIPAVCVVVALPFLAGIVTGISFGFAGASLPLVVQLMQAEGSGLTPLSTLVLAYGFGYMGVLLSPVHLCLLVTRDYFSASLRKIYARIRPCVLIVMIFALVAHIVLGWFGI